MNRKNNIEKPKTSEAIILVVDDDDVDFMGMERAVKKLKLLNPLVRAKDGCEGLEIMRSGEFEGQPFILLLDLNMPRMGGLEMLKEIRADHKLKKTVVFVLTTSSDQSDITEAYDYNVAGYIVKQNVEDGFKSLFEKLNIYWRIIELPRL